MLLNYNSYNYYEYSKVAYDNLCIVVDKSINLCNNVQSHRSQVTDNCVVGRRVEACLPAVFMRLPGGTMYNMVFQAKAHRLAQWVQKSNKHRGIRIKSVSGTGGRCTNGRIGPTVCAMAPWIPIYRSNQMLRPGF